MVADGAGLSRDTPGVLAVPPGRGR